MLMELTKGPQINGHTKAILLTSLLKLSDRYPGFSDSIKEFISQYRTNSELDIQTRSCEFSNLFGCTPDIGRAVLTQMPPITVVRIVEENTVDEQSQQNESRVSQSPPQQDSSQKQGGGERTTTSLQNHQSTNDSILLDSREGPAAADVIDNANTNQQSLGNNEDSLLLDLLQGSVSSPQGNEDGMSLDQMLSPATPTPYPPALFLPNAKHETNNVPNKVTAYNKGGLLIQFELQRTEAQNPDEVEVRAVFSNLSNVPFTEFRFVAAVPNYLQMDIFKATSDVIPSLSDGRVSQKMVVKQLSQGELKIKFKLSFKKQEEQVTDQSLVQHLPRVF